MSDDLDPDKIKVRVFPADGSPSYEAPGHVEQFNDNTGQWEPAEPLPFYRWVGPSPLAWARRTWRRLWRSF